jgi:hypothetical protein
MTTSLSLLIRGILKTFGLMSRGLRAVRFDRRVEMLIADREDIAPIIRPMLVV